MKKLFTFIFLIVCLVANSQNATDLDPDFNTFELPLNSYYVYGKVRKVLSGEDNKIYLLEEGVEGYDKIVKLNNNIIENVAAFGDNSGIYDFIIQPDGKIILSGFLQIGNSPPSVKVIRLNTDFSIDIDFTNNVPIITYGEPRLMLQPDGKVLLFNGRGGGALELSINSVTATLFALRVNVDGTFDNTFNYFSNEYYHSVNCFAIQPNGKILVATGIGQSNTNGRRVMRLNPDGSIDSEFYLGEGGVESWITKILVLEDGRILVGGGFGYYNFTFGATKRIVMLQPDGSIDVSFNSAGPESGRGLDYYPFSSVNKAVVEDMIQQPDGKIIIIGFFNSFNSLPADAPNCENIIRLNLDGSRDEQFTAALPKKTNQANVPPINRLASDNDGNIFVGGLFKDFNNQIVNNIVKIDNQGNLTPDFDNICRGFDGGVMAIREFNDGKILVLGYFNKYNGEVARRLVRLNPDGTLDLSFNAMFNEDFYSFNLFGITDITIQPDNKILIIGNKTPAFTYDGVDFKGIMRLNEDGSLDSTFIVGEGFNHPLPNTWAQPRAITMQPDGKIVVSGNILMYQGISTGRVIRILPNGMLDNTFTNHTAQSSSTIVVQNDGKIIASSLTVSQRLNSNGSLDMEFAYEHTPIIAVQSDGKYLFLYSVNLQYSIRRLLPDGVTIDDTYEPFPVPSGYQFLFNNFELQTSDKLLMSYPNNRLVRVNNDGTLDQAFDMPVGFSVINGESQERFPIKTLSDGKIMIGSSNEVFYKYNNKEEWNIVRILGDATLSESEFNLDKNGYIIYPNPVKDIVNITTTDNSTIKTIELFDIQGRLLQTHLVNEITSELDLASRANGMYFVKINTDKGSKVEKLIKE